MSELIFYIKFLSILLIIITILFILNKIYNFLLSFFNTKNVINYDNLIDNREKELKHVDNIIKKYFLKNLYILLLKNNKVFKKVNNKKENIVIPSHKYRELINCLLDNDIYINDDYKFISSFITTIIVSINAFETKYIHDIILKYHSGYNLDMYNKLINDKKYKTEPTSTIYISEKINEYLVNLKIENEIFEKNTLEKLQNENISEKIHDVFSKYLSNYEERKINKIIFELYNIELDKIEEQDENEKEKK